MEAAHDGQNIERLPKDSGLCEQQKPPVLVSEWVLDVLRGDQEDYFKSCTEKLVANNSLTLGELGEVVKQSEARIN